MKTIQETTRNCLTERELERLAGNAASDPALNEHVELCAKCRDRLQEIRDNLDLGRQLAGVELPTELTHPSSVPDSVAGYQLISQIARGGQGIIYKAIQANTKRKVAVKVLLAGKFASKQDQSRFEQEIDLASRLRHPHIITVYESGKTGDGRPYLAMEYIHGQPLDEYVRQSSRKSGMDRKALLLIFVKVCGAINHAHQRGVIHRDLKPSNILVDDRGEPYVLDFGLAKTAMATPNAQVTLTGEFKGTLAYASPEQAGGDPRDIDVRTDIYSLGVVLYEMLTGRLPYPASGHASATLRHILETEPEQPSTAQARIDDDLTTIMLKALAKDRKRRYQSASDLADDLGSYLQGEPIAAKRDKMWYVLRKRLRRSKVTTIATLIFAVVGFASGALLAGSWYRSSEIYRQLFQSTSQAMLVVDVDTLEILEANDACATFLGWTRDELLQMTAIQISDEPEKTAAAIPEQGAGHSYYVKQRRFKRADGSKINVEIKVAPLKWRGRATVVASLRDIGARDSADKIVSEPATSKPTEVP